eukprot:2595528-Pleurochrysis_carterae.AAC.1
MPASDEESRRLRGAEAERSERALKVGAGRCSRRGRHGVDSRVGIGRVCTGFDGLGGVHVRVSAG